jgi:nucleotide-binding universal stress UspA family protein
MDLRNIVAATDESDAGRQAVRTALDLAARCSAGVTVMRVVALEAAPRFAGVAEGTGFVAAADEAPELGRLHRWLQAGVLSVEQIERVQLGVAFGIPGIEICRYADENEADLLVLGRKRHSPMMRLLLGDTADAVARRSRLPCLFVPPGTRSISRVLVALDGSDRGMIVLHQACDFARQLGVSLQAITIEGRPPGEPLQLVSAPLLARSASLQARVREVLSRKKLPDAPLVIRRGDVLERIIAEAQETGADVLVVGYHRGGPPGVLEAGSTARRLAHASPCAVLTIPL